MSYYEVLNMNNKSVSKPAKKSVSYKQLPTKDSKEADVELNLSNDSLSEGYRLLDKEESIRASSNIERREIHFVEKEKRSRHEKSARSKYLTLSGHRRAESLGNVGQTRRHWSPPSIFMEAEQKDGPDRLHQGNKITNFRGNAQLKNRP